MTDSSKDLTLDDVPPQYPGDEAWAWLAGYEAGKAAAEAAARMQPIETAPKDGTVFLGWECGEPGIYYRTEDTPDDAAISFGTAAYPTHWMAIPARTSLPPEAGWDANGSPVSESRG
jgi:hypothetical protein